MVDDVNGFVDRQKVRDDLEAVFSGIGPLLAGLTRQTTTGPAAPSRETWGLGAEAEAGMAGMMRLAGGG